MKAVYFQGKKKNVIRWREQPRNPVNSRDLFTFEQPERRGDKRRKQRKKRWRQGASGCRVLDQGLCAPKPLWNRTGTAPGAPRNLCGDHHQTACIMDVGFFSFLFCSNWNRLGTAREWSWERCSGPCIRRQLVWMTDMNRLPSEYYELIFVIASLYGVHNTSPISALAGYLVSPEE